MRRSAGLVALALSTAACTTGSHTKGLAEAGYDPRYKVLTQEMLAEVADHDLEWAVVQHVMWTINEKYQQEREVVGGLPPGIRMVYTTSQVEGEVNNGGFNQYFFNTEGRLASEALAGYQLLGATKHAHLLRDAIAVHQEVRSRHEMARRAGTAEAFKDTYEGSGFEALDERFFALTSDLNAERISYIRAHPEEFEHP